MRTLYDGIIQDGLLGQADLEELDVPLLIQHLLGEEWVSGVSLRHHGTELHLELATGRGVDEKSMDLNYWIDPIFRDFPKETRNIRKISVSPSRDHSEMMIGLINSENPSTGVGPRDYQIVSRSNNSIRLSGATWKNPMVYRGWNLEASGSGLSRVLINGGLGSVYLEDMKLKGDRITLSGGCVQVRDSVLQAAEILNISCWVGVHTYLSPEAIKYIGISDAGLIQKKLFGQPSKLKKLKESYKITDILSDPSILDSIHPSTPRIAFTKGGGVGNKKPGSLLLVRDPKYFPRELASHPAGHPDSYVTLSDGWYIGSALYFK